MAVVAWAGFFCNLGATASERVLGELTELANNDERGELGNNARQLGC